MDFYKILTASIAIIAGCVGIWFDFKKAENIKWGVLLTVLVVVGGVLTIVPLSKNVQEKSSVPMNQTSTVVDVQKQDLLLNKSQSLILRYEKMMQSFNAQILQRESIDNKVNDNLRIISEISRSNTNALSDVKQIYDRETLMLSTNKEISNSQKIEFEKKIKQIESASGRVDQMSSNLILLENQLVLPIDHIDFYLRVNHDVSEKVFKYHKLRNHFSPDSPYSEKGNFRIEQKLNDSKISQYFLKLEHAFISIKDSTDQFDLISQGDVFGNIKYDDIYLFSNEKLDSLVARIDYKARITPELKNNTQLFVRSLTNSHGRIKVWIENEERVKRKYSFESVYLMIFSGNKEIGLSIEALNHSVEESDGKVYDYLDFRLGKEIFDHAIRSPR